MPARHGAEPGPTPPAAGKSPGVWRARLVAECTQSPGDRRPAGREPRNAELSICPAWAEPLSAGRYKQEARAGPTEGAARGPRGGGCWCPRSHRCPYQQEGVRSPQGDNGLCPVPRPQAASRKDAARTGWASLAPALRPCPPPSRVVQQGPCRRPSRPRAQRPPSPPFLLLRWRPKASPTRYFPAESPVSSALVSGTFYPLPKWNEGDFSPGCAADNTFPVPPQTSDLIVPPESHCETFSSAMSPEPSPFVTSNAFRGRRSHFLPPEQPRGAGGVEPRPSGSRLVPAGRRARGRSSCRSEPRAPVPAGGW